MPKKRSKSKSTDSDLPDLETRKMHLQSIGMPSPYRGGSTTTTSTDDSSSSSTATESSNAESKEPAAEGTSTSQFQSISESGKTCDNEVSTSICQEGDETGNTERLKPSDAASIRECQVSSKDENIAKQKESEPLSLDTEPTSKATKIEDPVSEETSFATEASASESMGNEKKSSEVGDLLLESVSHEIKDEVVCERESFAAETLYDNNIVQQENSPELLHSKNILDSSKTTVVAIVPSDFRFVDPCNSQMTSTMSMQSAEDRAFESVPVAVKETRGHKNIEHVKRSTELTKDSQRSPPKKVTILHGKRKSPKSEGIPFNRQDKELKYIDPDGKKEQAAHVKQDSSTFNENHPKHEVSIDGAEPRPKRASCVLSQEKGNADSQIKIAECGSEKVSERTGVSFKHTTEISVDEHETKRAKASFTGVRPKVSPRKRIRASSKRRTKSEPTSETTELPSKQRIIDIPQSESSSKDKGENSGMGQTKNYTLDVPRIRMSRARTLTRAKPERDEIVTRSKSSLGVSPRKRKSSDNTFPEKVHEQIPPKRAQRSSSTGVSPTPGTSSGVRRTSPRVHRPKISFNRRRSKSWTATRTSSKDLETQTMSVKEFLLFRGMTEPPAIPASLLSGSQPSTSRDDSSHVGTSREGGNENTAEESSNESSTQYETGSSISDVEIRDSSQAATGLETTSPRREELGFAEFKETLGADKVEDLDLATSLEMFDKNHGIDRSKDHSVSELKMITKEEFLETLDHGDGTNPRRVLPVGTKTGVSESSRQSLQPEGRYEGVSIEQFTKTLFGGKSPTMDDPYEILENLRKIMEKHEESSSISDEKLPSTSRTRTSQERQMDEIPFQDVRFRPRIHQSRYPARDCFDLQGIGNALDEVDGSKRSSKEGEIREDRCRPELLENSEESNSEDINRSIARSGLKLKRPQLMLSDDELTSSGRSDSAEGALPSESEICAHDVAGRIQGEDISETSQSSRESPEERSGKSSDRDEASSESPVEVSESLKKSSESGKNNERSRINVVPSVSGKQLGYDACKDKSLRHHLSESSDESDTGSPKKRQRKEQNPYNLKTPIKRRSRIRGKSECDSKTGWPYDKDAALKRKKQSDEH